MNDLGIAAIVGGLLVIAALLGVSITGHVTLEPQVDASQDVLLVSANSAPAPLVREPRSPYVEHLPASDFETSPRPDPGIVVLNETFERGYSRWDLHKIADGYVQYIRSGDDAKSVLITPNYVGNQISELWLGDSTIRVHPGDTIIMSARIKSGQRRGMKTHNGANFGIDLRVYGDDYRQVFTINGPATWSRDWETLYFSAKVPETVGMRTRVEWASSGKWGSYEGPTSSYWDNSLVDSLRGSTMPEMRLTPWIAIWLTDTVQYALFDDVVIRIIPAGSG